MRLLKKADKRTYHLVTLEQAKSQVAEQLRVIRTNITFALPGTHIQTILLTSTLPGEGKSMLAANLAVVFAQENKRVVVIDADLRKPTLHDVFYLPNAHGLVDVLQGEDLQSMLQETPIVGLDVLTSGAIPNNPAELLASKHMHNLLGELKARYDIVLLDAPPLLAVSDAQILAHQCDGTIFVMRSGFVEKEALMRAKQQLTASHATVLGVVLNDYEESLPLGAYY